ncbi:G-type lectin S-receptor-like serine/threonine-protein kinase At4g27290 [Olea europaea var. sylvestris]|uniref:G-type lectin S-receptor-like serine/threonine-protein kinase At4g27290 n=1 Tax=Olea europaea var. sylvestris TaxID=158386 RepID=UPI000C1CFE94|nr:G-type lectin S-receptor-like serine/threonine-protein kinase At4g27290 [Olea europaea var. sylvestris]
MMKSTKVACFLLLLSSLPSIVKICTAIDTISTTQILRDGDTLVSSGGRFELGFFSPYNTNNRYVGIWYTNVTIFKAVWVANRESPVTSTSGILKVLEPGVLVLQNDTGNITWSPKTSRVAKAPVLQLLDSGNLVLREANDDRPENFLWQSFDYITDRFLPDMDFGWNSATGIQNYLTSWTNNNDPAPGDYTYSMDLTGYPQNILKRGNVILCRMGPWNGLRFSGIPNSRLDPTYTFEFITDENKTLFREETIDRSVISRVSLSPSGVAQRWTWVQRIQDLVLYLNIPSDYCDTYKLCGAYGICKIANSPVCGCLDRFVPKDQEGLVRSDWSNGCIRRTPLNCEKGDVFLKYSGVKMPDSRYSWVNKNMTLEECKVNCLKNCSCIAYTQLSINIEGSGYLFWSGDLVDIRDLSVDGQDVYIRMASSEWGKNMNINQYFSINTSIRKDLILLSLHEFKRNKKKNIDFEYHFIGGNGSTRPQLDVVLLEKEEKLLKREKRRATISLFFSLLNYILILFKFQEAKTKTLNCHCSTYLRFQKPPTNNKLGQGGYGPVYKGVLENGQEIAVKRLSKTSMQGIIEFKNEVICIAKLQHRSLVKLLGYCIQGEEKMLIYEYMPNKSLDLFLFDETRSKLLDWPKRLQVVNGVARGLRYIHQDSQLRILHRVLKASNILLDTNMRPKISDFGIAKSFRGNETEDKTSRVVGT